MSQAAPLLPAGGPHERAAGQLVAELFERHGRMVYGLCRLLLRDAVEAEDAAQQSFLLAHRSILAGRPPRDAAAWLAAIARNECRGRITRRMREPLPLLETVAASNAEPDDAAARAAQVEALRSALGDLPHKQREAVVLRDLFGLGYREIGAAIGASVPAVEALLVRGRRRLQVRLAPLRDTAAGLVVPEALREALATAIPGFAPAGAAAGAGAALVGGGALKLGTPAVAKVAAATLAIGGAGTAAVADRDAPPSVSRANGGVEITQAASGDRSRPEAVPVVLVADDDERSADDDERARREADDDDDERRGSEAAGGDDEDDTEDGEDETDDTDDDEDLRRTSAPTAAPGADAAEPEHAADETDDDDREPDTADEEDDD